MGIGCGLLYVYVASTTIQLGSPCLYVHTVQWMVLAEALDAPGVVDPITRRLGLAQVAVV
jgi:hypothetical protein